MAPAVRIGRDFGSIVMGIAGQGQVHRKEPKPAVEPLWRDEADAAAEPGFRLGYRPDIEGLRAVAVSLVVAAHAGVSWLQGGFIGVDVFFVLSGYLITGLLLQEYNATRRVRLLDFYARRLRRLLPALVVMVLVTIAASAVLLSPAEQLLQVQTAKAAVLWVSNLLFAFGQLDYFGPAAESNVLLHTWSLGVEEQFYLAWPLLMLFLFGAFAKDRLPLSLRKAAIGTAVLVSACFLLSVLLTIAKPMWAYYLPVSRAWQFGAGALALFASVALTSRASAAGSGRWNLAAIAGWIGLALVVASAFVIERQTAYPGAWALLPTLGTALVLLAGASLPHGGAGRLLSVGLLEWIGRRSYGWYLWHWPVLILGATLIPWDSAAHTAVLVVVSLVLAAVSFATIENPIRFARAVRARARAVVAVAAAVMCVGVWTAHAWGVNATKWSNLPSQARFSAVRADKPFIYSMGCDDGHQSAEVRRCRSGDGTETNTAVLIGDSIAAQWVPALAEIYRQRGWQFIVITKSACPMVDEQFFYERIGRRYLECEVWRNEALSILESLQPKTVIVGSSPTYPFDESAWTNGSARILSLLSAHSQRVVVLGPSPKLPFDGPACVARAEWRQSLLALGGDGQDHCKANARSTQLSNVLSWLRAAARAYPNVEILDLSNLICPDDVCSAQRDGVLVFRDSQHLTASFVYQLAAPVAEHLSLTASRPHAAREAIPAAAAAAAAATATSH